MLLQKALGQKAYVEWTLINHKHRSGEHRIDIIFFDAFLLIVKREELVERIGFSIRGHTELIKTSLL